MDTVVRKENRDLIIKILELKEKLKAVILAHNYQVPEIQEIADYLGDSLELAKISRNLKEDVIVFCGVRFMAETAKILSPEKKVLLPVLNAGCPLADTITSGELLSLKKENPNSWVVSYVNTSAEIKALSDVCCTSSNAVKVVRNIPADEVIFVPDKNLGDWVKKNVPHKKVIVWKGFCYVHERFSEEDLKKVRRIYPDAVVMVHPECPSSVQDAADFVVSTSGMLKEAKRSSSKEFIIGTEEGLIYRLKKENPQKEFYSLGASHICVDMKKITLNELYEALSKGQYEITLDEDIIKKAKKSLERMVEFV